jgi:hypothetical protein
MKQNGKPKIKPTEIKPTGLVNEQMQFSLYYYSSRVSLVIRFANSIILFIFFKIVLAIMTSLSYHIDFGTVFFLYLQISTMGF